MPNDHVRLLIDLLRPRGGIGAEHARRWIVALSMIPEEERESVVVEVERRVVEMYGNACGLKSADNRDSASSLDDGLDVLSEVREHEGFVEEVVRTYGAAAREDAEGVEIVTSRRKRARA